MATIGSFTANPDGSYSGAIRTLSLNVKTVQFRPVERSAPKAPDFRIFAGQTEFGAAWKETSSDNRPYLSVKLDDPSSRRRSTPPWSRPTPPIAWSGRVAPPRPTETRSRPLRQWRGRLPFPKPQHPKEAAMSRAKAQTRRDPEHGADLYDRVTTQILADLQRGVRPWTRPWDSAHRAQVITRPLRHNLVPYSGINVLLLWARALEAGYDHAIWMTFRQALELGACVRKGETATTIVYANKISRTEQGRRGSRH